MIASCLSSAPLAGNPVRSLLDRQRVLLLLPVAGLLAFWLDQHGFGDVVRRLVLPDTDDAMRLVGVRDLLAGQGWFDNIQHRYLPPVGAAMHWSRLVDLPLAALVAALTPWFGPRGAEGVVVATWPPALFLAYLAILWASARRLFGFPAACFAILAATQSPITALFAPGRIDHHNVQALALTAAALCLVGPGRHLRGAALAGTLAAFSLAVGLETLPFVAALGIALVLGWIAQPDEEAATLLAFGTALALGSAAFFMAQTAPASWTAAECDALSPPWLILAGGSGLGSATLARMSARLPARTGRLCAAAGLGLALVSASVGLAPHCAAGPFAALPSEVRTGWLDRVVEVMPLWKVAYANPAAAFLIAAPMTAAIAAAIVGAWRHEGDARRSFLIALAFLLTGAAFTLVHLRGFYIGAALVPVVGGWVFDRALRPAPALRKAGLFAAAFMFLGTVSASPVLLVQDRLGLGQDVAPHRKAGNCAAPETLGRLDSLPPGLLLAPIDLGPAILLYTRHAIVAAPYHRNGAGLLAGLAVESGSPGRLADALRRFRPDYLVLCSAWAVQESPVATAWPALDGAAGAGRLEPVELEAGDLKIWRLAPPPTP